MESPGSAHTRYWTRFDSPVGPITLVGGGELLHGVYFAEHRHRPQLPAARTERRAAFTAVIEQLEEYFAGTRTAFSIDVAPAAGTPFQRRVWDELHTIPFGETCSYGELASRVGSPGASRAIGHANGRNPLSIIVPCHRVVGSSGSLTGYGGGLARKRWLLNHEANLTSS